MFNQYGYKATFFITGNNNGKGPIDSTSAWSTVIQNMISGGHQVASHTWSHQDLSAITQAQRYEQMIKNEMAFANILGKFPTYMRPPYSSCTAASGCEQDMTDLGYHVSYFDLDTDGKMVPCPTKIRADFNQITTTCHPRRSRLQRTTSMATSPRHLPRLATGLLLLMTSMRSPRTT